MCDSERLREAHLQCPTDDALRSIYADALEDDGRIKEATNVCRWRLLAGYHGEHRFFSDAEAPGTVAVTDRSGEWPSTSYDGVLYLDPSRLIYLDTHGLWCIPLVSPPPERKQRYMISPLGEVELVEKRFGMARQM